jgi:predicted ATPase/class 3 adenylate cyclase
MASLPTGTVTFLFSDIQGSTQLAERVADRWPSLLEEHRRIVRAAIAAGGGAEVSTEGDSFFVAFPSASGAIAAAVAAQRDLAAHPWDEGTAIRIRIGLHTGEASLAGDDYVGLEVHRAARIAAAGHGGQVLLSDATRVLGEPSLPDGVTLRDLGQRRLKDLTNPERIFQLVIAGLPSDFPPLKTLDATPNNLPTQLSSFLGRDRELTEVAKLLETARLLTLTGPGGTGKTRLALQVAARLSDGFPDGIFFVALASIRDPELVPGTVAHELGLSDRGGLNPMEALRNHLKDRRLLLILDNFEQLTDAAPLVGELLGAAPRLAVLVTSRSTLRVYGEREYMVPPLQVPDPAHLPSLESLSQYEAVALFIERAKAARPEFAVTNENAPAVAEICSRLDGLPLAIELAAARSNVLSPRAMLARLGHRLALLSGGARDRPERQQTLRGAIEWSHELLSEDERALFRRLAVFVGGARLDAIEGVCPGDELSIDLLDGLTSLVEKSLLRQSTAPDGEPRFFMLETIREYAVERLEDSGRGPELQRRHAEHYGALADSAREHLLAPDKRVWLDRLEEDHDNLRAALDWAIGEPEVVVALRLVFCLWRFWQMRGYLAEGTERARRVLALPNVEDHPKEHADALEARGGLAWWRGDFEDCQRSYQECLALRRTLDDPDALAEALYNAAFAFGPFGSTYQDEELSERYNNEALELWRSIGNEHGVGKALWVMANVRWTRNDYEGSQVKIEDALPIFRRLGDSFLTGWALYDLGLLKVRSAKLEEAAADLNEALRIFSDAEDVSGYTLVLDAYAAHAVAAGDRERAARISGHVALLERQSGTGLNPANRQLVGFDPARLRHDPALASAWADGERTPTPALVGELLAERASTPEPA